MFHEIFISDTAVKDVEKCIQIVCYSRKKEESLTEVSVPLYKQIEKKLSPYHQMESRYCKLLSVFSISFMTGQE